MWLWGGKLLVVAICPRDREDGLWDVDGGGQHDRCCARAGKLEVGLCVNQSGEREDWGSGAVGM